MIRVANTLKFRSSHSKLVFHKVQNTFLVVGLKFFI